jgi:sulfur-oxidizing protein SoxY
MRAPFLFAAIIGLSVAATGAGAADERQTGASGGEAWASIVEHVFDGRPMLEDGIVKIEAPARAEDAAIVPMTVRFELPPGDPRKVARLTLVVDENPAPVTASFELGPEAGVTAISTRGRVNAYTPVHAVAELSDGSLHVAETFVKASGGCSAPMAKDPAEALANLGKMKLRQFPAETPMSLPEAQVMIRHPNNSGMQMDQLTRLYIPAHFVQDITIRQGDELVLRVEGGIGLSEDPNLRFDFRPSGAPMTVEAVDTEGGVFTGHWPVEGSGAS